MRRISPWMSFEKGITLHCLETVDIRSYFDPHFPTFGLNTERYGVSRSRFFSTFSSNVEKGGRK